jgi:predicted  nucleic acid-binding Zn-ribbon protein
MNQNRREMSTAIDLRAELKKLVVLQQIDSEIFDLQTEKETFPERIKEMDALIESKKAGLKAAEDILKKFQVEKADKENDLRSREEKIKKDEAGMGLIKTNKEYKAMLDQIAGVKADISLVEEKILLLFDTISSAQQEVHKEKAAFEEESKKIVVKKEEIKAGEKRVDEQLVKLKNERENGIKHVDADIMQKYVRVLKTRGRTALSKLNGEFCGECNIKLRAQVVNDVRIMRNIVMCENCSRILYDEL